MTNVITCLFLIAGTTVIYRTLSRIETWWHREPEPQRQEPSNCQVKEGVYDVERCGDFR